MTSYEEIKRNKTKLIYALVDWADNESYDYRYFEEWLNQEWNDEDTRLYFHNMKEENSKLRMELNYLNSKIKRLEGKINELLVKEDE